jgi:hypothetical protein
MTEAVSQAYATCRIDPDDVSRRLYDLPRGTPYSRLMMPSRTGRAWKAAFQPTREPKRYEPGKNWKFRHVQKWPSEHGIIRLVDIGPYRNHGLGNHAGMVRAQCACGTTLWIACGVWIGDGSTKVCPDQCEGCRRQGNREINYAAAHSARRANARAWIGNDVTLARAKKSAALTRP